jgi:hypothetical protein
MLLGPIILQDYEVPSSIRFGGSQRVAVRTLSGGGRAIEQLGPDDSEIQFAGIISGPAAEIRAALFDDLRISGQIVWLAWEGFRRLVIVRTFAAEYQSPWWIRYEISCVVVQQNLPGILLASILAGTLASDMNSALAAAVSSGVSVAQLASALSNSNVAVPATADQRTALETVQTTLAVLGTQIGAQSLLVAATPPYGAGPGSLSDYVTGVTSAAGLLAAAAATSPYVGRIGVNLNG